MFNTSDCNKDFREWSEGIMTPTQERIKKLKEVKKIYNGNTTWSYINLKVKLRKKKKLLMN